MPFKCPTCGKISFHPADAQYGYCGACHDFTFTDSLLSDIEEDMDRQMAEEVDASNLKLLLKLRERLG